MIASKVGRVGRSVWDGRDGARRPGPKRVCIIAFKPVRHTVHVLRQIQYLAPHYELTVIGHGAPDPAWPPLTWRAVPAQSLVGQLLKLAWYAVARFHSGLYDRWYWRTERHRLAYAHAVASAADAFHANDWQALPIALAAARRTGGRVIFHMHEYAMDEREGRLWRVLVAPAIRYFMRRYTTQPDAPIDAALTVCAPIAARYQRELGLQPLVVFNAPKPAVVPERSTPGDAVRIRLIHHGYAKRDRGLDKLIEAVALTDKRFDLDLMLVKDDRGYIEELRRLAERLASGRVRFRAPVAPNAIVRTVAAYDLGLCVIQPACYNQLMMLPNKLFEYIQAGLAVCVGPSPAMADIVRRHGVGVVAPSFAPRAVADTLNRLTLQDIAAMQRAARRASAVLNADIEMGKVVALYRRLLTESEVTANGGVAASR